MFALSLLCMGMAAMAQNTEPDSTDVFYRHLELGEIVVTGLSGDTRIKEMAVPVSVIRPADLFTTASTNLIGALGRHPGIAEITTGGGISKPVIRGMGYNRVVVVNDGIRQEGQQWGDEHGIEIDGVSVHSVEIIKGPASLMYGSDALAGVILFQPEPVAAPGTIKGSASAEYQSNNGLLAGSAAVAGNRNGWVWNTRFSDRGAHAYRNRADGPVPNSGFRESAASGMVGRGGSWGYSRLKFSYFHLNPGIVEGEEGPLGYKPGLPFQHVRHFKAVSDNTVRLGQGNLKVLAGWQQNRRQEYEESAEACGLDFLLNSLHGDVRYQVETESGWKAAFGAVGMFQQSDNLGDEYLIPAYRLADAGIFATASRKIGGWTVSGGLREDVRQLRSEALDGRFEAFSRTFNGFSASIGAVRPLGRHFTVRMNLARGFRAPNLSELGSNGEHEGTLRYELGNKDLQPEFSLQGDIGLDYSSRFLSVQASLFASRIDHYIFLARTGEVDPEEALPIYSYGQSAAFLRGGELSVDLHPVHRLHIGTDVSYVHASQQDGTPLPFIPAPRILSEVKYEITHGDALFTNAFVALDVDWNLAQKRIYDKNDTETPTPAYCLLGASAGTDIVVKGIRRASLYLGVSNLLDTAYQNHLSRLKYADVQRAGRSGLCGMGRNLILKTVIPF